MKYILLSIVSLVSFSVFAQQKPFTLSGKVNGKTDGTIYLQYQGPDGRYLTDSATLKNGMFTFKGILSGPSSAAVIMGDTRSFENPNVARLYLVPANMKVSLVYNKFDEAVMTGSSIQKEAMILQKQKAPMMLEIKRLQAKYNRINQEFIAARNQGKDEATLSSFRDTLELLKDEMAPYSSKLSAVDRQFANTYPSSYLTAEMMRMNISSMPAAEAEGRYNKLSPEVKNSSLGKGLKEQLEALKNGSPGAMAYNFTSTELRGGTLSLSDYKGKYVLVDFWASWCVPCRKGNPHLLAMYAKYKDKGFEIIGVSDDDSNPEAWKKAVDQDKIGVWKHVLRGLKRLPNREFDKSASIADKYGIQTLPTKVLIDKEGKIIGRYSSEEGALDEMMKQIFGS